MSERACDRIAELEAQLSSAQEIIKAHEREQQLIMRDAAFWRRATEQAVGGWTALEDKIDQVVQRLGELVHYAQDHDGDRLDKELVRINLAEALEILVDEDPLEPPAELEAALHTLPEIDLGDGHKLSVVERETPVPHAGVVGPTEE